MKLVDQYIKFQSSSPSPFHVVDYLSQDLLKAGFQKTSINELHSLKEGQGYYIEHCEHKSLIAFTYNKEALSKGFAIAGAHTDSPTLRLKHNPFMKYEGCHTLFPQVHGGLILRSWLDRPLVVAGKVFFIEQENNAPKWDKATGLPSFSHQNVCSKAPIAVIPDLAIHLDRDKNKVGAVDPEVGLQIIFGNNKLSANAEEQFWKSLGCPRTPDGFEISVSPYWNHEVVGLDQSMVVGPRHDDLAMVFAVQEGLKASYPNAQGKLPVAAYFDAEETGSETSGGAASSFLKDVLSAICSDHVPAEHTLHNSFVISADMAHAFHPSHQGKHDQNHRPHLNKGLVIKENANDRYATSGVGTAIFKGLCQSSKIPTQSFVARQDMGCGSTIGPTLATILSCPTIDVGTAMWGMHSSAETMGVDDLQHAKDAFHVFFSGRPLQ